MRWLGSLPEAAQRELAVLARNFVQATELMRSHEYYKPRRGTLSLRVLPEENGEDTQQCEMIEDAESKASQKAGLCFGGRPSS